jgi:hypothetical protein
MAKQRIKSTIALAEKITKDDEKKERKAEQLCKACHYFSRIAGQAFTDQACGCCGEMQTYSSTSTDVLCMPCAQKHDACKHCGGDLN